MKNPGNLLLSTCKLEVIAQDNNIDTISVVKSSIESLDFASMPKNFKPEHNIHVNFKQNILPRKTKSRKVLRAMINVLQ